MFKKTGGKFKVMVFASFLFLFLLTVVSAESDERVIIKQVTDFDLKRPCFSNNTFCSAAAVCNLTIIKPADHAADPGGALIDNLLMTNQISYHNFTLSKAQTSISGLHEGIMACTDGTFGNGGDTFDVVITPSGVDDDSLRNLILLGFGFLFSLGMILFGFSREDPWIVLFGGFGLFVFGLYTLLNGVGNYRNTMTEWTSIIILGIAGYVSIRTGVEAMNV